MQSGLVCSFLPHQLSGAQRPCVFFARWFERGAQQRATSMFKEFGQIVPSSPWGLLVSNCKLHQFEQMCVCVCVFSLKQPKSNLRNNITLHVLASSSGRLTSTNTFIGGVQQEVQNMTTMSGLAFDVQIWSLLRAHLCISRWAKYQAASEFCR